MRLVIARITRGNKLELILDRPPWTLRIELAVAVGPGRRLRRRPRPRSPQARCGGARTSSSAGASLKAYEELREGRSAPSDSGQRARGHRATIRSSGYFNAPEYLEEGADPGPNVWTVVRRFTTEDGTGLVHIAPFGERRSCQEAGISWCTVAPVDEGGCFTAQSRLRGLACL